MNLLLLLASLASAEPPHLVPKTFGSTGVEVKAGTVAVVSSVLPAGAATESTQVAVSTTLTSIDAKLAASVMVTTVTAAVPIQRTQALLFKFYTSQSGQLTSGTAETPLALFVNPSTNTATAYLDYAGFNSVETNVLSNFRIYRNAVVASSGTARTILPGHPGAPASKMQFYSGGTLSTSGGTIYRGFVAQGNTLPINFNQAFIIPPGGNICITVTNSGNNRQSSINLGWAEE